MAVQNKLKTIRMSEFFLNKREFAKVLDISENQYIRYENNKNSPSLEICLKISDKLNRTVNDIWYID